MKAVRLHKEGGPEQLVYEDAPKPQLGAGDALIRVRATGITPAELTWAETYRNCDGSERLPAIPGHEVSGVVESVGGRRQRCVDWRRGRRLGASFSFSTRQLGRLTLWQPKLQCTTHGLTLG